MAALARPCRSKHCPMPGDTMYSLAECHGLPRLCRDASRLPRVVQATERTCAVLRPLCRSETVGGRLSSCSRFQRPGSDRPTSSPGVRTRARPSTRGCRWTSTVQQPGRAQKNDKGKTSASTGETCSGTGATYSRGSAGQRQARQARPLRQRQDGCRREKAVAW